MHGLLRSLKCDLSTEGIVETLRFWNRIFDKRERHGQTLQPRSSRNTSVQRFVTVRSVGVSMISVVRLPRVRFRCHGGVSH